MNTNFFNEKRNILFLFFIPVIAIAVFLLFYFMFEDVPIENDTAKLIEEKASYTSEEEGIMDRAYQEIMATKNNQ